MRGNRDAFGNPAIERRQRVERQHRRATFLLFFGAFRTAFWTVMIALTLLGLAGVPFLDWTTHIASKVILVALISYYANAATDLDALTSAFAARVATEARSDVDETNTSLSRRILRAVNRLEERSEGE